MTASPDGAVLDFAALGLDDRLLDELAALGYEEPTPIQAEAVPALLTGSDLVGQAATGTGKTAAFALPLLQRLVDARRGSDPVALVLVPTRELCLQVSQAIHRYGRGLDVRVLPVFGGQPIVRQLRELQRGVDVVVATPGRAVDHLSRGSLRLDAVRTVVLDEADEMLDMGFADDLDAILGATPADRQTVLFSATMPSRIEAIARRHLRDPQRIRIERAPEKAGTSPAVTQRAYLVRRPHKAAALCRVLDIEAPDAVIVFCRTRAEVDEVTETLNGRGYRAAALHGGMDQQMRDRTMQRFQDEGLEVLVATDVAARGLDIDHLTHVVNYDVPSAPASYVHRIGRVGRGRRTGTAITLVEPREHRMLKTIEAITKRKVPIEQLPTVADLRAQRLELTRAGLAELLLADGFEPYRAVVESLSDDHDVVEIAMAAVQLAHESAIGAVAEDEEIPPVELRAGATGKAGAGRTGAGAGAGAKGKGKTKDDTKGPKAGKTKTGARRPEGADGPTVRLQIAAGRAFGVRPQDIVGAIANETSVKGKQIGSIEIADAFSLVEVPAGKADEVIDALRATRIKGRKVKVRRDRFS